MSETVFFAVVTMSLFAVVMTQRAIQRVRQEHMNACRCSDEGDRMPREVPERITVEFELGGETRPDGTETYCCGYCSCSVSCWYMGNCCLKKFEDFDEAAEISGTSSFTCINIQLYPSDTTRLRTREMYWMITKCHRETIDRKIRDTCENPSTDGSFESVFPILGLRTGDYYRNRYCAVCDGIDPALIEDTHWTVDISCDSFISVSSDNLLQTFKRENCSIVFQPPEQENRIYDNDCYIPPYKISKCNVTKKWLRYDKDVDLACRSYIDPFNATYKNYHCYVCNVETPEPADDWNCPEIPRFIPKSDNFKISLDLHKIRTIEATARLNCDTSTQFVDYKMSLCRDIFCSLERELSSDGECSSSTSDERICIGVYIKLSPNSYSDYLLRNQFQDESYTTQLVEKIVTYVTNSYNVTLNHYIVFSDRTSASYSEGIIEEVYIYTVYSIPEKDFNILAHNIYQSDQKNITLQNVITTTVTYVINIDFLNIMDRTDHTFNAEMFIPDKEETRIIGKFIVLWRSQMAVADCPQSDAIQFTRISTCPYVKIRLGDLPMYIEGDGSLKSVEGIRTRMTSTRFHYQLHGNVVYLCLSDYQTLYQFIPMPLFTETEYVGKAGPRAVPPFGTLLFLFTLYFNK